MTILIFDLPFEWTHRCRFALVQAASHTSDEREPLLRDGNDKDFLSLFLIPFIPCILVDSAFKAFYRDKRDERDEKQTDPAFASAGARNSSDERGPLLRDGDEKDGALFVTRIFDDLH